MTAPYPLPRSTRETDVIAGDTRATYGPFSFSIWSPIDVVALVDRGEGWTQEAVVVTKTTGEPFSPFTVTFSPELKTGENAVIRSARL